MKKYVKNMKEYEKICQYNGFSTPISTSALGLGKIPNLPPLYGLGKIPRRSLLLGSGTLKNFELCLYTGSGI